MSENDPYYVLAFYLFTEIEDPKQEVLKHKAFFEGRDIKSRIYISYTGINAQMSGAKQDALDYMEWMRQDPRFVGIDFKIHTYHEQVFPRATVKFRKQLVALDEEVRAQEGGQHVSPKEWKRMLEEEKDVLVLDVRNDYEWEIGHFEGAVKPELETFRQFPAYVEALKETHDPKTTKVMMYCTGGIRCELYSALMKKRGFEEVYQLQGGVIRYGLEEGKDKWKGKLFVFDDRLAVSLAEEDEIISTCRHCEEASDTYYNCANMDCNELFLCCPSCAEKLGACCCQECQEAPRTRTYEAGCRPKPFRRKHLCEMGCLN